MVNRFTGGDRRCQSDPNRWTDLGPTAHSPVPPTDQTDAAFVISATAGTIG